MERSFLSRNAAALFVAAALLAGCGGAPAAVPSRQRASSLIGSEARGRDLLYVSSDDCAVYVFTYPRGKLVQTLNVCNLGFGPAFGLCTDAAGDVFMTMGAGFSASNSNTAGHNPSRSSKVIRFSLSAVRSTGEPEILASPVRPGKSRSIKMPPARRRYTLWPVSPSISFARSTIEASYLSMVNTTTKASRSSNSLKVAARCARSPSPEIAAPALPFNGMDAT